MSGLGESDDISPIQMGDMSLGGESKFSDVSALPVSRLRIPHETTVRGVLNLVDHGWRILVDLLAVTGPVVSRSIRYLEEDMQKICGRCGIPIDLCAVWSHCCKFRVVTFGNWSGYVFLVIKDEWEDV
jgi:hypothetical protein